MSEATESRHQLLNILNKYKIILIIAVPVIIAVTIGITLIVSSSENRSREAWNKLWEASRNQALAIQSDPKEKDKVLTRAINEFNYVINDISSAKVSPWAMFKLGGTYFASEKYDKAIETYSLFLKKNRNHYLAPFVKQTMGYSYEQTGQLKSAIEQFEEIDEEILLVQKNLDLGRCYGKMGDQKKAKDAYNTVLELENSDNNWIRLAQHRLDALN